MSKMEWFAVADLGIDRRGGATGGVDPSPNREAEAYEYFRSVPESALVM